MSERLTLLIPKTTPIKTGGCLQKHWRAWQQLSPELGSWVRDGVRLPWRWRPPTAEFPDKPMTAEAAADMDKAVARMLEAGAIKQLKSKAEAAVLSPVYTVPKRDSSERRPVFNLRWVNSFLHTRHFKMSTMRDVKQVITKDCWMAKIDLRDCFWQLGVHPDDQDFLCFHWRGKYYKFLVLPFGLAVSPRKITKLYRPVVAWLQAQGHACVIYLDDMILLGPTKQKCMEALIAVLTLLSRLGVVVNAKKSCFIPAQQMEYLGFVLDSVTMTITAPRRKIINLRTELRKATRKAVIAPRQLASVLGKLQALADALFPVRVHAAGIHQLQLKLLQEEGWDHLGQLTPEAKDDMSWWIQHLPMLNGKSLIQPLPTCQVGTDASDFGWGGWITLLTLKPRTISFGGLFPENLLGTQINFKELTAVKFVLQSCPELCRSQVIDLGTDNMTTLYYCNRMGGRNYKLARLAQEIWDICHNLDAVIAARHVPGVDNELADSESRAAPHL